MEHLYKAAAEALTGAQNVVITAHINPDGDAVGSTLGLYHALKSKGKSVRVVLPTPVPTTMSWMPGAEVIEVFSLNPALTLEGADTIVVLDLNSVSRLQDFGKLISATIAASRAQANTGVHRLVHIINIDHHTEPEDFADVQLVDTTAAATCQMLVEVLRHMPEVTISADCATCLYTGIMTDTGSFHFPRTTAALHRVVAHLIERGADPVMVYDNVYNHSPVARMRMLGFALSSMTTHYAGRVCIMMIRLEDMQRFGCTIDDVEGYVHNTLAVDGVEVGIMLVELPSEIKCSFRSKGDVYVNELAKQFGGGGHVYAAGARVKNQTLQQVLDAVLDKASTIL
ncbi:MAG: bifunctional oligoribonuclease/PAP phosphatase NrnA [bacterium]|nr:bifunctional oligoribonuclease/PAP phosphatase NrnA [bacterium]